MTKGWLKTLVVNALCFAKGPVALALCLGTFGVALTVVGVAPSGAATGLP